MKEALYYEYTEEGALPSLSSPLQNKRGTGGSLSSKKGSRQ